MNTDHMIYCVDGTVKIPEPGFYSIRFGRNLPRRALCIHKHGDLWSVFLDGELMAPVGPDWMRAFGAIFTRSQPLAGRILDKHAYRLLVIERQLDQANGIDPERPVPLHKTRVAL